MRKSGSPPPGKIAQRNPLLANGPPLGTLLVLTVALLALNPAALNRSGPTQARPAPVDAGTTHVTPAVGVTSEGAYFKFDYPPYPETFIVRLIDPAKIQEARDILSGQRPTRHIMGAIVKTPADYNPPWHYHLDPPSIVFFDNALEVCDATIQYVEEHIDQACDSFLPGCTWCPWGSRLIAEVNIAPTPTPTTTPPPTSAPTPTAAVFLPVVLSDELQR